MRTVYRISKRIFDHGWSASRHPRQKDACAAASLFNFAERTVPRALGIRVQSMTIIQVMTTISLADAKARLSAVLDEVRDTHERVVITRNGRPEAVILAVSDLEALEETLDLVSTPGALEEIRAAEAEVARGEAIDAEELRRQMAERVRAERASE
jgi:antitoxin YefM